MHLQGSTARFFHQGDQFLVVLRFHADERAALPVIPVAHAVNQFREPAGQDHTVKRPVAVLLLPQGQHGGRAAVLQVQRFPAVVYAHDGVMIFRDGIELIQQGAVQFQRLLIRTAPRGSCPLTMALFQNGAPDHFVVGPGFVGDRVGREAQCRRLAEGELLFLLHCVHQILDAPQHIELSSRADPEAQAERLEAVFQPRFDLNRVPRPLFLAALRFSGGHPFLVFGERPQSGRIGRVADLFLPQGLCQLQKHGKHMLARFLALSGAAQVTESSRPAASGVACHALHSVPVDGNAGFRAVFPLRIDPCLQRLFALKLAVDFPDLDGERRVFQKRQCLVVRILTDDEIARELFSLIEPIPGM